MTDAVNTEYSPYRNPSVGDLIIRTSDGVDFHIHHRHLADISPIFSDTFSLPQPNPTPPTDSKEKSIVDISETSVVWEKLLPICHVAEEPFLSLDDIQDLLEAARKYGMIGVTSRLQTPLFRPEFLDETPFAVYALACSAGFTDVARLATR